jgi:hypothetical protein
MFRVEYNIQTGERVEIPLTPEEIAAFPPPVDPWPAAQHKELTEFFALRDSVFAKCTGIRLDYEDRYEAGLCTLEERDTIKAAVRAVRAALDADGWKSAPGVAAAVAATDATALRAALLGLMAATKNALPPLAKAAYAKVDK